ncbi:hypothetical protein SB764_39105, partial [Paraburkholderia sp. SIMBA_027]
PECHQEHLAAIVDGAILHRITFIAFGTLVAIELASAQQSADTSWYCLERDLSGNLIDTLASLKHADSKKACYRRHYSNSKSDRCITARIAPGRRSFEADAV